MKKLFYILIGLLILNSFSAFSQETDHLSIKSFTNKEIYSDKDTQSIALKINIKEKFHINSYQVDDPSLITTSLNLEMGDFTLLNTYFPADKLLKFEFSDSKIRVYEGENYIGLKLISAKTLQDGEYPVNLKFNYQACDNAVCYSPKTVEIKLNIKISKEKASKDLSNKDIFAKIDFTKPTETKKEEAPNLTENNRIEGQNPDENKVSNFIEERGMFLGLLFIFLGGLALNLTPCIYPLIPITISYFGAQSSGNRMQSITMGIFYALGMAITYTGLGLFAALTGSLLGTALQNPLVIIGVALILAALATSMFGLWEIRVPQKLALAGNKNRSGFLGSLLMGFLVGFIAAPCIGPFVLSLLVYVGKVGNPFMGFLLFFVLSMGLGLPYIFLAAFSSAINKLPRSGEWMIGVKIIFGFILIGMAINTLEPIIPKEIFAYLYPLFIIFAGIYLIAFDKKGQTAQIFTKIKYLIAIIAIIYGTWILKPESHKAEVQWNMLNSVESIESSVKSKKSPVMIDFYADWCAQCKELDKYTYTDNNVAELSKSFNNIKIDLTKENKAISDKYNIKGLPVVIFINAKGEEIKELRVTGFLKPEEFITKMKTTLDKK
ncbi:MAG: protein-disulfide reductase DsbD [Ignavibacteria bacterium]|jgi:thiol:disulfide interchange protein DsbD